MRKANITRPFKPDFCSAATLAYRLDCSERTVLDYSQGGLLPKPQQIGNLVRWNWAEVTDHIYAQNISDTGLAVVNGEAANEYVADLQKYRARLGKKASSGQETDG